MSKEGEKVKDQHKKSGWVHILGIIVAVISILLTGKNSGGSK